MARLRPPIELVGGDRIRHHDGEEHAADADCGYCDEVVAWLRTEALARANVAAARRVHRSEGWYDPPAEDGPVSGSSGPRAPGAAEPGSRPSAPG